MSQSSGTHECVCGMGCGRGFPFQSRHECEAQVIGEDCVNADQKHEHKEVYIKYMV